MQKQQTAKQQNAIAKPRRKLRHFIKQQQQTYAPKAAAYKL
jgi:hypothetical protein